jgi:TetR/AcrR family transcriptional repressor of nem operon
MFRCGYRGASVRDICNAAGAPHGSFTNHFGSKEEFAVEVLDQYFDYLKGLLKQAHVERLTPLERLKRYLDIITGKLERDGWKVGCLIGDLSLETSSYSSSLRKRLDAIFREWRNSANEGGTKSGSSGAVQSDHVRNCAQGAGKVSSHQAAADPIESFIGSRTEHENTAVRETLN